MSSSIVPEALLHWAVQALQPSPGETHQLDVVAGDASSRRYFRLRLAADSFILVDAPPATEKNTAFLAIQEMLETAGIRVPRIIAADLERGFMLQEDLGDDLLLASLADASVDGYYSAASDMLLTLASTDLSAATTAALPAYDEALLREELSRFPEWFVQELLGYTLVGAELALWDDLCDLLVHSALLQPQVLVHRDFHSRNLMLLPGDTLGLIDFQDAVRGPITYDLVSLLKDCYIRWPQDRVREWALCHRERLVTAGLLDDIDDRMLQMSDQRFLYRFDLMGLQRHIKVLGTFARLYLRDGKASYLKDLPLVIEYVLETAEVHAAGDPLLAAFAAWFRERLSPLIAEQEWAVTV